ncbi:alpha/beta fold hydrolase [Novosphingobium sp. AP12]|uniref:alpha/beta fold hydrolase n=1 Tax=Novosphingobium sp. AP12 TaxID=1144305 RepID=UPI000271FBE8|nr:alpha/beta fold hydrolase [Novosphingobium sp. AP12]EJL21142.1 putative hydrolase or acyltransferase of alpha/beta superfamily [Novosphingobium sp. AP12]
MNGPEPLVLVPGLTCDAEVWRAQMEGLSGAATMTIADTLSDDSIAAMAQRLLDTAPELFALAGFSMGGYVAMAVAARAPERVTRLALLDTNAGADDAGRAAVRRAAVRTARERGFETVLRGSLGLLVHPDADPALGEAVVAMALRVGIDAFERQQAAIIGRPDALPGLAAIGVPALVLVGAQDRTTPPRYAEEIAAAIPGAVLRKIERCGHMVTMEQPEAVNAALREWLAS